MTIVRRLRDFLTYPASFWLAFLVSFLSFASLTLLLVPFPIYLQEIGADPAQVGIVIGAFALSAFLSRPVVGRLTDRWGRVPVLVLSGVIFSLGPLGYLAANSIPPLLLVRLFHGLSISTGTTAFVTLIADIVPAPKRGEGLGLAAVSIPLAITLFPPIGVALHRAFAFEGVFLGAALIGALATLIALAIREPARHSVDPVELVGNGFISVARRRQVWVPSLLMSARAAGWGVVVAFLPLYAAVRQLPNLGLFFTVYGITLLIGNVVGGRLSDRLGRVVVIAPMTVLVAVTLAFLNFVETQPLLLLTATLYGLGMGSTAATMDALLADGVPLALRGTGYGVLYGSFDLGVIVGTVAGGFLAGALGYGPMFLSLGLVMLLVVGMFAGLMRNKT